MPANVIKKVANKCNYSEKEVEQKWNDAKEQAKEQNQGDNYGYIMSIFKHMIGKDCLKKLDWELYEYFMEHDYPNEIK